jgi:hypothetical protein
VKDCYICILSPDAVRRHQPRTVSGVWDAAPLETELLVQADHLVGGSNAVCKSIPPMAERLAPGNYDQLHHFVAAGARQRMCPL